MVQLNALTETGTVIHGPMQDSAEEGIEHGWEKTARNPAICVEPRILLNKMDGKKLSKILCCVLIQIRLEVAA